MCLVIDIMDILWTYVNTAGILLTRQIFAHTLAAFCAQLTPHVALYRLNVDKWGAWGYTPISGKCHDRSAALAGYTRFRHAHLYEALQGD